MTDFSSNGMSAVPSQGKRLASEDAIHRVKTIYMDEKTKELYETIWGYYGIDGKRKAMTCLEMQRKRKDCVSATYLDPTAPVKAEQYD